MIDWINSVVKNEELHVGNCETIQILLFYCGTETSLIWEEA